MFKKILIPLLLLLLITPFVIVWFGNVEPPTVDEKLLSIAEIQEQSHFYDKKNWGVHHVVLTGSPFARGQQYGYWTHDFLLEQEKSLIEKLDEVMPSKILQYALFLFSMAWFQGLEDYYETEWLHEMYGVSLHGSKQDRFFATPFTRQLAYHGIHDMGQMMIDRGLVMGACTQVARHLEDGWLIGRNFDFEGGRVFDEDKIVKWVFPEQGQAFVSVIFSGMVGVVSGINESGVYIAINAAGSDDFTRLGTPTTLVALQALQKATTAKEAVDILKSAKPLITDIFVVADQNDPLYVVEKTPTKTEILVKDQMAVVTNHLQSPSFQLDKTNRKRKQNNTTLQRLEKATKLLSAESNTADILNILRDKQVLNGQRVLGHRASIDALIASHALIYNSKEQILYVAKGPSLSKEFVGIDLNASFSTKKPVLIDNLPEDPDLQGLNFHQLKASIKQLKGIRKTAGRGFCSKAKEQLKKLAYPERLENHYAYFWTQGRVAQCFGHSIEAKNLYQKALQLKPAYLWERNEISEQIQSM